MYCDASEIWVTQSDGGCSNFTAVTDPPFRVVGCRILGRASKVNTEKCTDGDDSGVDLVSLYVCILLRFVDVTNKSYCRS
jgi:hypothetical protein